MTVRSLNEADATESDPAATPDSDARQSTREELGRYADQGGFTMTAETHPWLEAADAVTGPEDARAASTVLAELRSRDIRAIGTAVSGIAGKAGLDVPDTLTGLRLLVGVLQRVQQTAATLRAEAYEADLDALAAATGTGRWRKQQGLKLSWGRRRALRAQARGLAVGRFGRADLHTAFVEAIAARTDWSAIATDDAAKRPVVPVDGALLAETAQAVESLGEAVTALGRLLTERALESQPLGELADLVDRLAADEGTLYRLSNLRTLREALADEGLAALLDELADRQADREAALAAYDRHVTPDAARQALAAGPRTAEPETETETVNEAEALDVAAEPAALVETEESAEEPVVEAEPAAAEAESDAAVETTAVEEPEPVVEAEPVAEAPVDVEPEPIAVEESAAVEPEAAEKADGPVAVAEAPELAVETEPVAEVETEPVAEVETPVVEEASVAEAEEPAEAEYPVVVEEPAAEAEPAEAVEEPEAVEEADAPVAGAEKPELAVDVEPVAEEASVAETVEPAEAESADVVEEPESAVEAEPVVEAEPAGEAEPVAEAPVDVEPEPIAVEESAVVEPEAADVPVAVAEEPEPVAAVGEPAGDSAAKPELTPGKPITAYAAEELVALVRWFDADGTVRSDDELLRAAMKELGFARLGPRIKEALGAAVAEVRS